MNGAHGESGNGDAAAALVVINHLVAKPGRLDELMQAQQAALPQFAGRLEGWQGSRLYRSLETDTAILVSAFDNRAAFERFRDSGLLAEHRRRLAPLLERAGPEMFTAAYAAGVI